MSLEPRMAVERRILAMAMIATLGLLAIPVTSQVARAEEPAPARQIDVLSKYHGDPRHLAPGGSVDWLVGIALPEHSEASRHMEASGELLDYTTINISSCEATDGKTCTAAQRIKGPEGTANSGRWSLGEQSGAGRQWLRIRVGLGDQAPAASQGTSVHLKLVINGTDETVVLAPDGVVDRDGSGQQTQRDLASTGFASWWLAAIGAVALGAGFAIARKDRRRAVHSSDFKTGK